MVHETKPPNEEWKKLIVESLAKKMNEGGYSLMGKAIPYLIAAIIALLGIVYTYLITNDAAQKAANEANAAAIAALTQRTETENTVFASEMQTMSANIYLLCQSSNAPKCLKPDTVP